MTTKWMMTLCAAAVFVQPAPAQTCLLEAESFQYQGGWKTEKDPEALGKAMLMVTSGGGRAADALTVFEVAAQVSYHVWSRTKDFAAQAPGTRTSRLLIDGTPLALQGVHRHDGYRWEKVGVAQLTQGKHVLQARDVAANYARLDAVLLTADESLDPNRMTARQLAAFTTRPVLTALEQQAADRLATVCNRVDSAATPLAELSNGLLRLRLYRQGDALMQKVSVKTDGRWVSPEPTQPDNGVFLIKSKQPGLNYSGFLPAWTGGQPRRLRVAGKRYDVYESADLHDPFRSGTTLPMKAYRCEPVGTDALRIDYVTAENDSLSSLWTLPKDRCFFRVDFTCRIRTPQYYSLAFAALHESQPQSISNVLLSPLYQFRRLPATPNLLPLALTPQPVSMVERGGMCGFVAPVPSLLSRSWGACDMGFSLKNRDNQVQPVAFAPIPGSTAARKEAGATLSESFVFGLLPLAWHHSLQYLSDNLFNVKDYRQQTTSLTDAAFHIVNLLKSDEASGWDASMRGFLDIESNPRIRTEVVQAAPLGLLSAAVVTHDESFYLTRALPAIEYMLSRKGFRWGFPNERDPQTETMVNTFTPYKSQYNTGHFEALHRLLMNKNPWLVRLAMPEGKPRYSKGYGVDATWADDLAAHRLTGDEQWLVRAMLGANRMIDSTLYANPSRPVHDWMFYHAQAYPQWFDLLDLYDVTREKAYLAAAAYGAHFTMAAQRSYPPVDDTPMTIHPGGRYTGNANIFWKREKRFKLGYPRQTGDVVEKQVDGRLLSPVGLSFEQPMTFFTKTDNLNHVYLSTWAPSLLRLNTTGTAPIFETYARNAVIGRFASYPGYYAAGYTDLPLDSLYPYKGPDVTSLYYHHIPSHLTFTFDYLVTEATQRSRNAIRFPYGKQQGFVWFNNRVYGGPKGTILHDNGVRLHMPQGVAAVSSPAVNWLSGVSDDTFWLVMMNERDTMERVTVSLNTALVAADTQAVRYDFGMGNSVESDEVACQDHRFVADMAPKGLTAIAFPLVGKSEEDALPPVADGMRQVELDKTRHLYLFRIRSPFGWDSVYGYIDRPLPEGCSAELSCLPSAEAAVEKPRAGFPCEWSFTRLPARRALKLQLVLRKGARTTLTKSVGFPAPAGMKD